MNKKRMFILSILGLGIGMFIATSSSSNEEMKEMDTHNEHQHSSHQMMGDSHTLHDSSLNKVMEVEDYEESLTQYFILQQALANDSLTDAQQAAKYLAEALGEKSALSSLAHQIHHSDSLNTARPLFESLSKAIEVLVKHHGSPEGMSIGKYHCPMVDKNRGASWLQDSEGTKNPYFGEMMPRCGSKIGTL